MNDLGKGSIRVVVAVAAVLVIVWAAHCTFAAPSDVLREGLEAAKRGDIALAKDRLGWVVTNCPTQPVAAEAAWKLGSIAANTGEVDTARARFNWVIEHFSRSYKAADALLSLATMDRSKDPLQAVELLTEVIVRYPASVQAKVAKVRIAEFHNNEGDYEQAMLLASGVRTDSKAPDWVKAPATIREGEARLGMWRRSGDPENLKLGIALLEEVPQKYPKMTKEVAMSQVELAIHYNSNPGRQVDDEYYRRNPAKARSILQDALDKLPANHCTWWMRSEIMSTYLAEKRWEDALAECNSLLATGPPAAWRSYFLYIKGDTHLRLDQKHEGIAALRQLVSDYPNDNWARAAQKRLELETKADGGQQQ